MYIEDYLKNISSFDDKSYKKAIDREINLIKPPRSLGVLEDIACKICAIVRKEKPILSKKRLLVFASDNGVYEENVSSCPQNITVDQTINLTRGITGASSMARYFGDEVVVYDLGVNYDIDKYIKDNDIHIDNKVIDKKISYSTKNISKEPAMTIENMNDAICVGIDAVKKAKDEGVDIIGVGEMGICNTTTSTAILSLLSGVAPDKITGRGAGLTDAAYRHKIDIIKKSIDRAFDDNKKKLILDHKKDYIYDILREVGGYDIAAMVGAYIGAAYYKIPTVIDGFIGIVAALSAYYLHNDIKDYMFTSHESMEPGYVVAKDLLGIRPMFNLDMRLGEGSGCIVAFRIIDSALAMHNDMKTFDEVNIDDTYLDNIR